jgi:uncharacterized membrane protein
MLFFGLIIIVTLLMALVGRLGVASLDDWRTCMRWGMAVALWLAGIDHFASPERYVAMMPAFVPLPYQVALFTGACEIAGGIGLVVPQLRRLAGIMLAIYFCAVFPANIKNAVEGLTVEGLPAAAWYYWVRLLFQPLVIWWALYAATVIDWPLRAREREA